jgi:hypothetical protein
MLYVLAIRFAAMSMADLVNRGEVAMADLQRLILPAYLAGGTVMTIASVFNPISPSLILLSGAGASFGLNAGLLFLPNMVVAHERCQTQVTCPMAFSLSWFVLGIVVSALFIGVLDPGIHFSHELRKRTFTQADARQAESQHSVLQKTVAIAFPLATGLRNEGLPCDF